MALDLQNPKRRARIPLNDGLVRNTELRAEGLWAACVLDCLGERIVHAGRKAQLALKGKQFLPWQRKKSFHNA